jgi:hypothetical protein
LFEVIKWIDFSVYYGHRTPEEQLELFKKGRQEIFESWQIVDKKAVVTYKDGFKRLSNHNYTPSRAADLWAFPIDWKDLERQAYLAATIVSTSWELYRREVVEFPLEWGADWNNNGIIEDERFVDRPHLQENRNPIML